MLICPSFCSAVCDVDWLSYIDPHLHSGSKSHWVMVCNPVNMPLNWFPSILLSHYILKFSIPFIHISIQKCQIHTVRVLMCVFYISVFLQHIEQRDKRQRCFSRERSRTLSRTQEPDGTLKCPQGGGEGSRHGKNGEPAIGGRSAGR